jgi:hypothetical protein
MGKYVYPKEVTESNFPQLSERAKRLVRNVWVLELLKLVFVIISMFIIVYILAPIIYSPFLGESLLSLPSAVLLIVDALISSLIISSVIAFWYIERLDSVLRFIFRFPRNDEMVFAECFIIANFLTRNNRLGALRRAESFTTSLSLFTKDYFNPRRRVYADEFQMLESGKRQIERMLLFSEEKVSGLFANLGLALVTGNDTMAYFFLRLLVRETQQYGELQGRLSRILSQVTRYEVIIVSLLTILGAVIAYFLGR